MKKIAFCGGGSAGHVIPNIALIEELKNEYDVYYIGTGGIEKSICAANGVKFNEFQGAKLVRGKILTNLALPFKLFKSIGAAGKILDKIKPDLIFCKGGYVSVPPAIAAKKRKIPVITHESDLTAGLANKIVAAFGAEILTSFPSTAHKFKRGVYTGSPMRKSLFNRNKAEARARFGLDMRPTLIVFGGGSGAKIINENIRKIAIDVCREYNILHICGKGNIVNTNIYGYKQVEFVNDMGLAYACADGAVARCGSNSAYELITLKIPTLFIPLQNSASRGDQVKNAQFFENAGLCRTLSESVLTPVTLKKGIYSLMCDSKLKNALNKSKIERGNERIIKEIKKSV